MADTVTIFAGPCSIEDDAQCAEVAACIAGLGLHWMRGGAFKPRTSPWSFQGLGEEGLQIARRAADAWGLKVLTEVLDVNQCALVDSYADGFQIGTRNMANYALLQQVGKVGAQAQKLVLLKRGMAATIQEWLNASEYLVQEGSANIMLCERGIRTFEPSTRYTLDISAVPVIHKQSILPVCVDVSHPAGQRDLVPALARAAVAAGCDALMIEVHPHPERAKSDGPQQLTCGQFERLVEDLRAIAAVLGKTIV